MSNILNGSVLSDTIKWIESRLDKEETWSVQAANTREKRLFAIISSYIGCLAVCWSFLVINKRPEADVMAISVLLLLLGHLAYRTSIKDVFERNEALRNLHLGRCLRGVFCRIYPALSMYTKESVSDEGNPLLKYRCASGAGAQTGVNSILSTYEILMALLWGIFFVTLRHSLPGGFIYLEDISFYLGGQQIEIGQCLLECGEVSFCSIAMISFSIIDLFFFALCYATIRFILTTRRSFRFIRAKKEGDKLIEEKVNAFQKGLERGTFFHFSA